ncbi:acyl-CoA thioesterase [Polymorphobacter fuscus]|uniref:Acyl-CoA thioesterase 2 n=1 Tax=Sandarakinorhabdus fusca TaxID=1439888 RepID=A0A7C9GMW6_9SPHN|nr:acyl-CoA thioesterase II [Polymorphobacter fuscus]KAB7648749.1 acyl-CoA thioesterase II [Polymorphobacter fuscus]MQT16317.1 acyl-CoA thioesterase II [Polymorphobacter fuscus]NJC07396.1 acyl-CoA thioesterase-2 [Polymorphobacter fuscus]
MTNTDPAASIARLLTLLDVEPIAENRFRGQSTNEGWMRVYGGQVVAQALMAASKTVADGRLCHSLHSYFIRPGDPAHSIDYVVERDRDGQSFTTRRVVALQKDRPIFNMAASFQTVEPGLVHGTPAPRVTPPEELRSDAEWAEINAENTPEPHRTLWRERERPLEFRPVEPMDPFNPEARSPRARHWCRAAAPFRAGEPVMRALFAYASDMTLLDTCLLPHAIGWSDPRLQVASLDHAIWFNATPDLNDWLLFDQDSPSAAGGRGLNRGIVHDRTGAVVANIVQEGLIRYRTS